MLARLVVVVAVLVAGLLGPPAQAVSAPVGAPIVAATAKSGTFYFIGSTPGQGSWVWRVQVRGKKIRTMKYYPSAGEEHSTNGWARIQDRRIKGICTNRFVMYACPANVVISKAGRVLVPAGGRKVTRPVAETLYPEVKSLPWTSAVAYPHGEDDSVLTPCASSWTTVARQLRAEGAYPVSRTAKPVDVAECRGNWAWMQEPVCLGDCAYVARRSGGKWRFAFGLPARPGDLATAPAWVRNRA